MKATAIAEVLRPVVEARVRASVPVVAVVLARGGDVIPMFTTATRPTPSVEWEGRLIYVKDPGAPATMQVCGSQSGGGYEWGIVWVASS